MTKPKTADLPTADDIRKFIESVDRDSLLAASHPDRGIMVDDPGVKKTYEWLLTLARSS